MFFPKNAAFKHINIRTSCFTQLKSETASRRNFATNATEMKIKTAPLSWSEAKPLKAMPTLKPLNLLSGFLPGGRFANKDLNEITCEMLRPVGDILVIPGTFGKPANVLTQNPEDFETVYRHDGPWPIREGFELLNYHRKVYRKDFFGNKTGLETSQGKDWFDFRSAVNPIVIHPKNVKVYLKAIDQVSQEFVERIKAIRDPSTLEVPENFKDDLNFWTLESISIIALDRHLGLLSGTNPDGKRYFDLLHQFFELSLDLEIKPSLWRQIATPKFKKIMAVCDESVQTTDKYIQEAVERLEKMPKDQPNNEKSVLEKLLSIDRKLATVMAMDMLFAGVDTTTTTLAGLLLALAKYPDKQEKLREEIRKILPQKNSPLTMENMKSLPYLRACIKESLRYYPVTIANVRTIQENLVLSGYQVPSGTEVTLVHTNLFRDPAHFSEPNKFIPERWLRVANNENVCPREATKSSHPFAYLPFGFGPRSCIGRRIAEMEVEIGIARILRNFKVEFNYSTEKAFKAYQLSTPAIPLRFKFTDLTS